MKRNIRRVVAVVVAAITSFAVIEMGARKQNPDASMSSDMEDVLVGVSACAGVAALALTINHFLRRRWA